MKYLMTLAVLIGLSSVSEAGCRARRCKPAANSCQPCQPVSNAVHATANVIAAPVRILGNCAGGCCGGACR